LGVGAVGAITPPRQKNRDSHRDNHAVRKWDSPAYQKKAIPGVWKMNFIMLFITLIWLQLGWIVENDMGIGLTILLKKVRLWLGA
jgi:hypothetical protein